MVKFPNAGLGVQFGSQLFQCSQGQVSKSRKHDLIIKDPSNIRERKNKLGRHFFCSKMKWSSIHSAAAFSCIHFHTPTARPASVTGHSLPSTACSLQSTSDSQSGDEKLPSFAFHGTYYTENEQTSELR